jgi:hypothetical protein
MCKLVISQTSKGVKTPGVYRHAGPAQLNRNPLLPLAANPVKLVFLISYSQSPSGRIRLPRASDPCRSSEGREEGEHGGLRGLIDPRTQLFPDRLRIQMLAMLDKEPLSRSSAPKTDEQAQFHGRGASAWFLAFLLSPICKGQHRYLAALHESSEHRKLGHILALLLRDPSPHLGVLLPHSLALRWRQMMVHVLPHLMLLIDVVSILKLQFADFILFSSPLSAGCREVFRYWDVIADETHQEAGRAGDLAAYVRCPQMVKLVAWPVGW